MSSRTIALLLVFLIGCHTVSGRRPVARYLTAIQQPVLFGFDRWKVLEAYRASLDEKAKALNRHRGVVLTVEGHTDRIGDADYNLRLGDRRARAVKLELVRRGVAPNRLTVVSHGETRPVAPGGRRDDHARNRRVEFVVR